MGVSQIAAPADRARQAVFFDRDGVLNAAAVREGKPYPPASLDEVVLIPGIVEACGALHEHGILLFCTTNQPDVARGKAQRADVEAINRFIADAIHLDGVAACFHDDVDNCDCRKPRPGMLKDLAALHGVDLRHSVMVGDRWRDIEAGSRAGCATVFIDYGYDEKRPSADLVARSVPEALPGILKLLEGMGQ